MDPERLGKYELRRVLGKGAMGTVYEGWDPAIERTVAIKTVRLPSSHDPDALEEVARFRREAQAAGRLSHPNIVGVYDTGETGDLAWIVMEYVDGPSLKATFDKNERMPLSEIGRVMDGLLAGLAYSHQRGVVHRDIKPANVMLTTEGAVKIADFGIARIESSSMTQVGTVLGTPAYMSPEQFRGETVDARSDIYSAGVVLYQLLTGERPFDGSASAIMHKALNTEPPRPSDLAVTTPTALDPVVARAMAKRPSDRYASAAEFADALRRAIAGGGASQSIAMGPDAFDADATMISPATATRTRTATVPPATAARAASHDAAAPRGKSSMGLVAGGGAAGLAAIAAAVWFFVLRTPEPAPTPPQPPQATTERPAPPTRTADATPPSTPQPPPPSTPQVANDPPAAPPPQQAPSAPPQPPAPSVQLPPLTPQPAQPPQQQAAPAQTLPPAAPPQAASPAPSVEPAQPPAQAQPAPAQPAQPPPSAQAQPATPPAPQPPQAQTPPQAPPPQAAVQTPPPQPPPPAPPQQAPPQQQVAAAGPTAGQIREALSTRLAGVGCTLATGDMEGERARIAAVTRAGLAENMLRAAISAAAPGRADLRVRAFTADYCPALDAVRGDADRFGIRASGLTVALRGGGERLLDHDAVRPVVTMPDFPAYLTLLYLTRDEQGQVWVGHLHPNRLDPGKRLAPRQRLDLDPKEDAGPTRGTPIAVGEPFGTDVMLAIATEQPLFPAFRSQVEPLSELMPDLNAALAAARQRGSRVAANAFVLETAPRP